MEGAARAAKRRHDENVVLAWHTAALGAAAQAGKLKGLAHYLEQPRKAQTADEMLAAFQQFKARGAGMNIQRVH